MKHTKIIIAIVLLTIFYSCDNKTKQKKSIIGKWSFYTEDAGYSLDFSENEEILLTTFGFFDAGATYKGTYKKLDEGEDTYAFSVVPFIAMNSDTIKGRFTAQIDENNYLHFKIITKDLGFNGNGYFQQGLAYKVDCPNEEPTIIDLFKAVYPFTFEIAAIKGYKYIAKNKPGDSKVEYSTQTDKDYIKIKDLTDNELHYLTEYSMWQCSDKENYLLGINNIEEYPNYKITSSASFYSYNSKAKTLQTIDLPYKLSKTENKSYYLKFPQDGKDIEAIFADKNYKPKSYILLKWNGEKFDPIEKELSEFGIIDSENVWNDNEAEAGYECTKETAKDKYCYVKKVEEHNGKNYIVVDYIQFLSGEEAIKEAKKRGIDNGDITNDYIILNDNPKLRTFLVPNDIKVPIIAFDDNGNRLEKAVSITEINLSGMYRLTVKDGVVKSIKEEYLP